MIIENPAAYRFIIDEDLYLLNADKDNLPTYPVSTQPTEEPVIAAIKTQAISFKYKGTHKKGFVIIVHYPSHEFMADEHLIALTNILKRKELAIEDVAILNYAAQPGKLAEILSFFKPQKVLIMGKSAIPADLPEPAKNQLIVTADASLLYSLSFEEMMSSNDYKKAFWDQMKNL